MPYVHRFNENSNGNHIIGLLVTNSIKFKVPGKVLGLIKSVRNANGYCNYYPNYDEILSHTKYTLMFEYSATFDSVRIYTLKVKMKGNPFLT